MGTEPNQPIHSAPLRISQADEAPSIARTRSSGPASWTPRESARAARAPAPTTQTASEQRSAPANHGPGTESPPPEPTLRTAEPNSWCRPPPQARSWPRARYLSALSNLSRLPGAAAPPTKTGTRSMIGTGNAPMNGFGVGYGDDPSGRSCCPSQTTGCGER